MPTLAITKTPNYPASQNPVDARGLTIDEVIRHLVGHTIDEVERGLILHTLIHCCGSRTRSANILGISIRCMRNKIREYEALGIAVPTPGEPRVERPSFSRIAMRSRHY
jgi:DNA-binding NtrC family response regulator